VSARSTRWLKCIAFGLGLPLLVWASPRLAQALAPTAGSQEWQLREITAEVPGHSGTTYSALIKQVIPDLQVNETIATGHLAKPLRHIAAGYGGELPVSLAIGSLRVLTFTVDGRQRLAILTDIGSVEVTVEQPTLLAIFDDDSIPKLLDAVDVGMDRDTSYGEPALVSISHGSQALVTRSNHFNSNESFETTALIILQAGRLKLVDTFSTYGVRTCSAATRQLLTFQQQPVGDANTYSNILATIEETKIPTEETCDGENQPAAASKNAQTVYRWDDRTLNLVAVSDVLEKFQLRTGEEMSAP
jgi:hypothetical protein